MIRGFRCGILNWGPVGKTGSILFGIIGAFTLSALCYGYWLIIGVEI